MRLLALPALLVVLTVPGAKPTDDQAARDARLHRKARKATPREPLPRYVTECESGGNLRAQNPSSSAGGRYQILVSTWNSSLPKRLFIRVAGGDHGPRFSSRLLQDKVAWTIRKRDGLGTWSCA